MTKQEAFEEINNIQSGYVNDLVGLINCPDYSVIKTINFTSPTGTGKTKMMSKLINSLPDCFFVVTTLSRGQLHLQVRHSLVEDCNQENFIVYGSADYRINSKLEAEDIIGLIPNNTKCIWIRDEGHIKTNRYEELLSNVCYKVINFSATNISSDIKCNFTQTMMLRTVNQDCGTPEKAIKKLIEVKESHKKVGNYNPCAIFRCVAGNKSLHSEIVELCRIYNLKYIDLNDDPYIMAKLCEDNDENDVIINKFKLTEGIDIRRAHVLYMDNQPQNNTTVIQAIGRCRRNALLYRDDIDILAPENKELLVDTRQCFVFYNVDSMHIDEDINGELQYAFCDRISCEELKANSIIHVENGQLPNGLYILELIGKTGNYEIVIDQETGFNIVKPINDYYDEKSRDYDNYFYFMKYIEDGNRFLRHRFIDYFKVSINDINKFPSQGKHRYVSDIKNASMPCNISDEIINLFEELQTKYTRQYVFSNIEGKDILSLIDTVHYDVDTIKTELESYINTYEKNKTKSGEKVYSQAMISLMNIDLVRLYNVRKEVYEDIPLSRLFSQNEIIFLRYFFLKKIKNYKIAHNYEGISELNCIYKDYLNKYSINKEIYKNIPDYEKITYYIIENDIFEIIKNINVKLKISWEYPDARTIKKEDIYRYFKEIDEFFVESNNSRRILGVKSFFSSLNACLFETLFNLKDGRVDLGKYNYSILYKSVTESERYLLEKKFIHPSGTRIDQEEIEEIIRKAKTPYTKIINDKESAIIGTDLMRPIKDEDGNLVWVESKSVSSKVGGYNKLNRFISKKYEKELSDGKTQMFTGKNNFILDKKCNSMIGYCVEYYSKYILYGKSYLSGYLYDYQLENVEKRKYYVVRACMQKYKEMMVESFGIGVARFIKIISEEQLLTGKYDEFVNIVIELGERTAIFVKNSIYPNKEPQNNIDPNLSILHISGLADYITEDSILDVKVRNNIDEKCIRQVLAYHYLSTKRTDLHIKRVIVYDATSDRAVKINITEDNLV